MVRCNYFILNLKLDNVYLWPVQQCSVIYLVRQQLWKCRLNVCVTVVSAVCFCLSSLRRIFAHKGMWYRACIMTVQLGLSVSDNHEINTSKISANRAKFFSQVWVSVSLMVSICISSDTSESVAVKGLQSSFILALVKIKIPSPPLPFFWLKFMLQARFKPLAGLIRPMGRTFDTPYLQILICQSMFE